MTHPRITPFSTPPIFQHQPASPYFLTRPQLLTRM